MLEVASDYFRDSSPIFSDPDPFVIRFKVVARVLLDIGHAIPIFEDSIWPKLSLTRHIEKRAPGWAQHANLRASLRELSEEDGALLAALLAQQSSAQRQYALNEQDRRRLSQKQSIRTVEREVFVEVPEDHDEGTTAEAAAHEQPPEARESFVIQATVARIGAEMGLKIWVPPSDRQRILELIPTEWRAAFLERLPLNYNDTTIKTIEQIDVIWLKGRSMARAFEIEHSTAVYSGLLRMADLLALQPNMDIRLHIVAPDDRREKVFKEIKRPVFSLLERGPLYESCSYLSYEAVSELAKIRHLGHMHDSIVEEYEEFAQDE